MSINVAMHGSPVCFRRDRILADLELLKKNETMRRRKLRLEQVREHSKDIANQVLHKVKKEKEKQLGSLKKLQTTELRNRQAKQLLMLQQQYHDCLEMIGMGHRDAELQADVNEILSAKQEKNLLIAQERGKHAEQWFRQQKNAQDDSKEIAWKQQKLTRAMEDLRASMVASLERPTSPTRHKEKKSVDEMHRNVPVKSSTLHVLSKHRTSIIDDGEHISQLQRTYKTREYQSVQGRSKPNSKACIPQLKKPVRFATSPKDSPHQDCNSETSNSTCAGGSSRPGVIKGEPCCKATCKCRHPCKDTCKCQHPCKDQQPRVQLYDYGSRYQQEYVAQPSVEKLDSRLQPDANAAAELEVANMHPTGRVKNCHRRAQTALTRERVSRDYHSMIAQLSSLVRVERTIKSGSTSLSPAEIFLGDDRRRERSTRRQKNMDSAFESFIHNAVAGQEKPKEFGFSKRNKEKENIYPSDQVPAATVGDDSSTPVLNVGLAAFGRSAAVQEQAPCENQAGCHRLERLMARVQAQRSVLLEEVAQCIGAPGHQAELTVATCIAETSFPSNKRPAEKNLSSLESSSNTSMEEPLQQLIPQQQNGGKFKKKVIRLQSEKNSDINDKHIPLSGGLAEHLAARATIDRVGKAASKQIASSELNRRGLKCSPENMSDVSKEGSSLTVTSEYSMDVRVSQTEQSFISRNMSETMSSSTTVGEVKIKVSVSEKSEQILQPVVHTPVSTKNHSQHRLKTSKRKNKEYKLTTRKHGECNTERIKIKFSGDKISPRKTKKSSEKLKKTCDKLSPQKEKDSPLRDESSTRKDKLSAQKAKSSHGKRRLSPQKRKLIPQENTADKEKKEHKQIGEHNLHQEVEIGDITSTSTSYLSPPQGMADDRAKYLDTLLESLRKHKAELDVCTAPLLQRRMDPKLTYYIAQLLTMSRESVNELSASSGVCGDTHTAKPSHRDPSTILYTPKSRNSSSLKRHHKCRRNKMHLNEKDSLMKNSVKLTEETKHTEGDTTHKTEETSISLASVSTVETIVSPASTRRMPSQKGQTQNSPIYSTSQGYQTCGVVFSNLHKEIGVQIGEPFSTYKREVSPRVSAPPAENFANASEEFVDHISDLNRMIEEIRQEKRNLLGRLRVNIENYPQDTTCYLSPPPFLIPVTFPTFHAKLVNVVDSRPNPEAMSSDREVVSTKPKHPPICWKNVAIIGGPVCELSTIEESDIPPHSLEIPVTPDKKCSSIPEESHGSKDGSSEHISLEDASIHIPSENETLPDVMNEMMRRKLISSPLAWMKKAQPENEDRGPSSVLLSSPETDLQNTSVQEFKKLALESCVETSSSSYVHHEKVTSRGGSSLCGSRTKNDQAALANTSHYPLSPGKSPRCESVSKPSQSIPMHSSQREETLDPEISIHARSSESYYIPLADLEVPEISQHHSRQKTTPDDLVEPEFNKLGVHWAGATLRKTKEAKELSLSTDSENMPSPHSSRPSSGVRFHTNTTPQYAGIRMKVHGGSSPFSKSFPVDIRGHSTPVSSLANNSTPSGSSVNDSVRLFPVFAESDISSVQATSSSNEESHYISPPKLALRPVSLRKESTSPLKH